jgi:hypothetical protein
MDRMSECREAQGSARVTAPVKELKTQVSMYVGRVKRSVPVKMSRVQKRPAIAGLLWCL